MKTSSTSIFLSFLLLISLSFCNDIDQVTPGKSKVDIGQSVTRSITGTVINENNEPVTDAEVTMHGRSAVTDKFGSFFFEDAQVFEKHAFVKVIKAGYLLGSRSIMPTDGINRVEIKLLPANNVGTVKSSDGGSVQFEKVTIDFPSAFVDEFGNDVSGNVSVKAKYIDPNSASINEEMPGSLRAISNDGETLLQTFGMVGVELTDASGTEVQIKEGFTAELKMPIPDNMLDQAPESIPLWHFDEEDGIWIEEGQAIKVGKEYVGEVGHFSFWNCDIRVESTTSYGRLVLEDGTALDYAKVNMKTPNAGTRAGYTCSEGKFGGLMPANVAIELIIEHLDFIEGEKVTIPLDALTNNEPIGDIVIPNNKLRKRAMLTTNILDCNGGSYPNCYVSINGVRPIKCVDGKLNIKIGKGVEYNLIPIDYRKNLLGLGKTIVGTGEDEIIDNLELCSATGTLMREYKYTIDGKTYNLTGTGFYSTGYGNGSKLHAFIGLVAQYPNAAKHLLQLELNGINGRTSITIDESSNCNINFSSDWEYVKPIIPLNIVVTINRLILGPGTHIDIEFSGTYQEWNIAQNKYVTRTVSDGVVRYIIP